MRLYSLKNLAQILVIELSWDLSCSETATVVSATATVPTASVATTAATTTTTITTTITTTNHPDDLFQSGYITPGFKRFS